VVDGSVVVDGDMVTATATTFVVIGWVWCDVTRWWVVVIVKKTPHRLVF
jgi:hypothetical protein